MHRRYPALWCCCGRRQANSEERTARSRVFPGQRAVVRLDDTPRDCEAHAGSFRFRREEWLEQLINDPVGKAWPGILHAHANLTIAQGLDLDKDTPRIGPDNGQGVEGVYGQVEQHLQ